MLLEQLLLKSLFASCTSLLALDSHALRISSKPVSIESDDCGSGGQSCWQVLFQQAELKDFFFKISKMCTGMTNGPK